jgi:hypothetical protein
MHLKNTKTGKLKKAKIDKLRSKDQDQVKKSKEYKFDWKLEKKMKYDLYKIYLLDQEDEILGLLSLKDIKEELRIHINLIEISSRNVGKGKEYDRIAGSLIAYAAQLSFDKSYDGFVSLVPKTRLINHYCKKYGFEQFGRQLGLGYEASVNLIKTYL